VASRTAIDGAAARSAADAAGQAPRASDPLAAAIAGHAAGPLRTEDDASSPPSLHVGRARAAVRPSGHFDVDAWGGAANTHTLLAADGTGAVPVSESRFMWGQDDLYIFFYAGDLDLQARATKHDGPVWKDDSVTFAFFPRPDETRRDTASAEPKKFVLQVTPTGITSDGVCPLDAVDLGDARCDLRWESGARVGADYDGTPNDIRGFDEEWAVEVALPLRAIGVDPHAPPPIRVAATVRRCEMAHGGPRACGLWGDPERPGELFLDGR
jgi:hypothetical protein